MKVLSLFDGMSCSQIALQGLGIKVDTYYASEVDKYAIEVTQINFPDTVQVGDVTKLDPKDFADVDLIVAGSPCQGFSFAGKQLNFNDPRSALFFEFIRLLKAIKPKYFLLENVRMKKEYQQVITEQVSACYPNHNSGKDLFGGLIEPILINSSLVSAQSRQRLYWTNIPNIKQPEERGIVLRDILETDADTYLSEEAIAYMKRGSEKWSGGKSRAEHYIKHESKKSNCLTANMHKGVPYGVISVDKPKQVGIAADVNGHDILKRVYSPDGKSPTLNTMGGGKWKQTKPQQMLELRKDNKSNAVSTVGKDTLVVETPEKSQTIKSQYYKSSRANFERQGTFHATGIQNEDLTWRKLTVRECRRLQTIPEDYQMPVSNTQAYKLLGNGFTCEVIKHIFKNMEL
jgi:DNA (cytosine-5)-methyltransferase 3A